MTALIQRLPHPSDCNTCLDGLGRMRRIYRMRHQTFPVKTWCKVCGTPALIEVRGNYEQALRYAYRLDEAVMVHQNHEEKGGWGVHWRLDEVLYLVFPNEHTDDVFPTYPWYQHRAAEDQKVVIASDDEEYLDNRRREMINQVNAVPKTRRELESLAGEVWDSEELTKDFEVLGFRAPFVVVESRIDGARGSLMFQGDPRFYFNFERDRVL